MQYNCPVASTMFQVFAKVVSLQAVKLQCSRCSVQRVQSPEARDGQITLVHHHLREQPPHGQHEHDEEEGGPDICDDDLDEIDNSDTDFVANTTCHYWGEFAVSQLIADNADDDAESPSPHESIKNKLLVRNIDY